MGQETMDSALHVHHSEARIIGMAFLKARYFCGQ